MIVETQKQRHYVMSQDNEDTHTTTGRDGDLYRVSARLAHFFQVQRFV